MAETAQAKPEPAAPPPKPEEASAKPGTKNEDGKREKKKREKYPVPEDGLEAWPEDFDASKHKPLKKTDFKNEAVWLDRKAEEAEEKAKRYRQEAETVRKIGSTKDQKKAKKLLKVQSELAELRKALAADGVDVDALLAEKQ